MLSQSEPPGLLLLSWTRQDETRAAQLGLTRVDRSSWQVTVPESEVTDLAQVRSPA